MDSIDGIAATIVIRGTVIGDVSGAAGSVRIADTGTVGGDLDVSTGSVVVDGVVDGNAQIGAGSFEMTESGRIGGDLEAGAGYVRVDGGVDGTVRAGGASVAIGPNANVGEEFRYDAEEFTQSPDAVVGGGVVRDPNLGADESESGDSIAPPWFGTVYSLGASLLFGVVLLAAFPRFSGTVATRVVEDPARSAVVGVAALVAVPIALVLIGITVIGIPLTLIGIALFVLGIWVAVVYGKYAVGRWAIGLVDQDSRWLALFVGLVGFAVLGLMPILGSLIELLVFLVGLGALVLALGRSYQGAKTAAKAGNQ